MNKIFIKPFFLVTIFFLYLLVFVFFRHSLEYFLFCLSFSFPKSFFCSHFVLAFATFLCYFYNMLLPFPYHLLSDKDFVHVLCLNSCLTIFNKKEKLFLYIL